MHRNGELNRSSLLLYWIIPLVFGIVQTTFNLYFDILPWGISLVDGMIFGILLGGFGMATWFVVKYNSPEKQPVFQLISTHIASSVTVSVFWVYTAGFFSSLLVSNPTYTVYLDKHFADRIFFGLFFNTLATAFFYLYIYYRKNIDKSAKENELRQEVREAVLRALQAQINPHFLFNSLNSIASLTQSNPDKAHEMVISLSDFMRYALRKQHNEMVRLEEELNQIRLYLQIEKIRFGEKMTYSFSVDPECLDCQIPTLLLQPLFENAVKYGVYEASDAVEIKLTGKKENDFVVLTIANSFDPDSLPAKGEGIGLKNVMERLRLVYNSNGLMKIDNQDATFVITLHLPVNNEVNQD